MLLAVYLHDDFGLARRQFHGRPQSDTLRSDTRQLKLAIACNEVQANFGRVAGLGRG